MRDFTSERTVSPSKTGLINGKFKPSPIGFIEEKRGDNIVRIPANRRDRRALLFPNKAESKKRIRESKEERLNE